MFPKGKSGNANGRPKAVAGASARLSRLIDESSNGGKALHEALAEMVFGSCRNHPDSYSCACTQRKKPTIDPSSPAFARLRLEALSMLFDRWAGKPQVMIEVEQVSSVETEAASAIAGMSPSALLELARLLGEDEQEQAPGIQ